MPLCYAPWTNIDIQPAGRIVPCCRFEYKHYQNYDYNIITTDLQEYKDSTFLKQIKQELENNQWPAGCERCKLEENSGVESKRTLDYTRWEKQYQKYNLDSDKSITAAIAFGNTCNFKCITCSASSSSRWYKEYSEIYNVDIKPNYFYKHNFVEDMILQCPELTHLDILGGEPFLSGIIEQKQLLDHYISTGQAKNITLHYTTNTSIFPDSEWWDKWQNFKKVEIQLSVDGVGRHNEYIRYLSNWNDTETNIKLFSEKSQQLNNFQLSISHTLSCYNVYYLDDFFQWCKNNNLPTPWVGRVHNPEHMRSSVFPRPLKQLIVKHLRTSNFDEVCAWADLIENSDDSKYFDYFLSKTKEHDEYRGNSFTETFPELAELIAKSTKDIIIKQ